MLIPGLVVLACLHTLQLVSADFFPHQAKLRNYLLGSSANYRSKVRPSRLVHVELSFQLLDLDIDPRENSMTTFGVFTMKWKDSRLTWLPSAYGNIEYFIESGHLWRPFAFVKHSMDISGVMPTEDLSLRVDHLGNVIMDFHGIYKTSCMTNIVSFPVDEQSCYLACTPWPYTISEVVFFPGKFLVDKDQYGEWKKDDMPAMYDENVTNSDGTFSVIYFELYMQRDVGFYALSIVLPIMFLSVLSVLTFLIPFKSREKVTYALTVVLAFLFLLVDVLKIIPLSPTHVSFLGIYLGSTFVLACTCTARAIINFAIFYNDPNIPMSKLQKFIIEKVLVPMTGWRKLSGDKHSVSRIVEAMIANTFYSWREVAHMADVECFRFYGVLVILMGVIYMGTSTLLKRYHVDIVSEIDE